MSTEPQKSLLSRRRLLIAVLVLCLLVVGCIPLILHFQPTVAHASGSGSITSNSGVGCCGRFGIALVAKLQNQKNASVSGTWSCALPIGAKIKFAEIIVSLSQKTGNYTTRASTAIKLQKKCTGFSKIFHALVKPLAGTHPFHTGKAHVTATFSIGYYQTQSSYYDLLLLNLDIPDATITITK